MDDRVKYTDDLLDERFVSIERRLGDVRGLPASFERLSTGVEALAREVQQLRTDFHEDMSVQREDTRQVSRVLLGFLTALLVAMLGAILAVVVVL